jgi:hypothetical protein
VVTGQKVVTEACFAKAQKQASSDQHQGTDPRPDPGGRPVDRPRRWRDLAEREEVGFPGGPRCSFALLYPDSHGFDGSVQRSPVAEIIRRRRVLGKSRSDEVQMGRPV